MFVTLTFLGFRSQFLQISVSPYIIFSRSQVLQISVSPDIIFYRYHFLQISVYLFFSFSACNVTIQGLLQILDLLQLRNYSYYVYLSCYNNCWSNYYYYYIFNVIIVTTATIEMLANNVLPGSL